MNAPPADLGPRGMMPWLLQRVSGLFLAYALIVHLWAVHVVNSGRLNWEVISARLSEDWAWSIYYLLFIPALVYHAANGLWGIVLDHNPPPALKISLLWGFWLAGMGLTVYGYFGIQPLLVSTR